MKPQNNCKNSRWGGSSPTEAPIQPTSLITASTVPVLFTVCYQRHGPDQFRDMKNKTAFLPKPSNFQALWFSFVKDCRLPLPLLFQSAVESNKKRNLKPSPAETGEGIPVPGPMGWRDWASAVSAMLPLLPGWPQPGPVQFLPLLIGLEKGK